MRYDRKEVGKVRVRGCFDLKVFRNICFCVALSVCASGQKVKASLPASAPSFSIRSPLITESRYTPLIKGPATTPNNSLDASSLFIEASTFNTNGAAGGIADGDLNGDGNIDVVVGGGGVVVVLGNGDGSFQAPVNYLSASPGAVVLADVNGDSKLDIVVTIPVLCDSYGNCIEGAIGVLVGNGDGTFEQEVTYGSAGNDANGLVLADVNGDGKLDAIVANCGLFSCPNGDGIVSVLLGNGDGSFRAAVPYDAGSYQTHSISSGDVNGDGRLDIVVANECTGSNCASGSISVLLGNGDGTLQAAALYSSGGLYANAVATGDFNGDGRLDVAVASNVIGVLLGNGDGTFQSTVTYPSGGGGANAIVVSDLNGDGRNDLIATNYCAGTNCANGGGVVAVLVGNGDGSFRAPQSYGSGGYGATALAVADVNGDGKYDVLMVDTCNVTGPGCGIGFFGLILGNGDGTFQAAVSYGSGGYYSNSVAVGDLNADGRTEVVVANYCANSTSCPGGGVVGVLIGDGDGTFRPAITYGSGGNSAESVSVADVNRDGIPDLVVSNVCASSTNCSYGTVGFLLGNGDGTFKSPVSFASGGGGGAHSLAVGDVNADGKLDVVIANYCVSSSNCINGVVGVLLGNGDGTFQNATAFNSGGYFPWSVALADVNGDGKLDIVMGNECAAQGECTAGLVSVLIGNGDGTFHSAVVYGSGGFNAQAVVAGDVNSDGKIDIAVENGGGGVGVLLGNGDGTFQTAVVAATPASNGLGQMVLADLNGDGVLDIASAVANFVALGNGDGTFQPAIALGFVGQGIAAGDFNGDGKVDLAVGGVTILLHNAFEIQVTKTTLTSSSNPSINGQSITFTAIVSAAAGGVPSGTVTFYDGGSILGESSLDGTGSATFSTSTLGLGTHSISAKYSGDSNFAPSTSLVLSQLVQGSVALLIPTALDFGNQTIGIGSSPQNVALSNVGNISLSISSIGVSGVNSSDFAETNTCPSSLPPNGSCTITITFKPLAVGTRSASVNVTDNALGSPQSILVSGVGLSPGVTFSVSSLKFPTQIVFTTSAIQTTTLTNSGAGILTISRIAATSQFLQTNTCGASISPGGSCTISVRFKPTTKGQVAGSIAITDNAPGSPQKVKLTGVGTFIQTNPVSEKFGNQPVGTTSVARQVIISNKGNSTVSISSIAITGTNTDDFAETNTCGSSLASGASCKIVVTFTPTAKGKRTANVAITDNGGGSPQMVGLSGTGT
jgi:hypothetical protein